MSLSQKSKRELANPAAIVVWGRTTSGKTARMGARTAAHLDWTRYQLSKKHPGAVLHVIQPAYNTGVAASAGTHDKDGCIDVYIEGMDWLDAQAFLRACGWAAWYRYPPLFGYHIHMISLGCPGPLGQFVPGQISDYYNHRNGLAGHAADSTWHPADIDKTVFDYRAWLELKEVLDMNNVQLARVQLQTAVKALSSALNDLRKVPKKRAVVVAQIAALTTSLATVRAILKRLPAN